MPVSHQNAGSDESATIGASIPVSLAADNNLVWLLLLVFSYLPPLSVREADWLRNPLKF